MKSAIATLSLLLVACTPKQQPVPEAVTTPADKPSPVATDATPTVVTPMAKRAAGQESVEPLQIFRAFGTEPFWNLNVVDTALTFTTPDDPTGVVLQGERHLVEGGLDIIGISPAGNEFTLRMRMGDCSDGMSDNHYAMTSTFQTGERNYTGCGEVAQ